MHFAHIHHLSIKTNSNACACVCEFNQQTNALAIVLFVYTVQHTKLF